MILLGGRLALGQREKHRGSGAPSAAWRPRSGVVEGIVGWRAPARGANSTWVDRGIYDRDRGFALSLRRRRQGWDDFSKSRGRGEAWGSTPLQTPRARTLAVHGGGFNPSMGGL